MADSRETSQSRQRQIVSVARRIIATRGMDAFTIRELDRQVGVSDGDIYRHFTSKREILLLLIDDTGKTMMDVVERAAAETEDPLQSLENILEAHLSSIEQKRGVSLIVIRNQDTLQLAAGNVALGFQRGAATLWTRAGFDAPLAKSSATQR